MATNGKSLVHVLRANPETIQMLPRNTGMNEDTTETGGRDLAHLKDLIRPSTTAVAIQDIAGTGAS